MKTTVHHDACRPADQRGFTLTEVVVCLAITLLIFSSLVIGFTQAAQNTMWSGYNLAAQSLAQQGLEQARSATWDPLAPSPIDYCAQSNFPATTTNILDIPTVGTNLIYATNTWYITNISGNPYPLKMIRVDCTWSFLRPGQPRALLYTNSAVTLRAPNQ